MDVIILSDYYLFQQFSAIRRSLTQKLQHNHGTHFGKDFASKADKLQQGAPCLDRLMLGRKKITEEDIWRTIEMQFCIKCTEDVRTEPFRFRRMHKNLKNQLGLTTAEW